jgi:methylenetetrahydrofolate reductase (NADPH)
MIVHIAARMVRSREHLDALLTAMAAARVRDVFLVGGDAPEPLGPYAAGLALLREMRVHELAPRTIGVPAYPEGHPQIPDRVLSEELGEKCRLADYVVTQMCFDPGAVVRWLERTREAGVELPVYVGVPGLVDRRRLLEISMRVGVGTSISYLRKQHGVHHLLGGARAAAAHLVDAIAPLIGGELGVAGLHFFTFNRLVETERFARDQAGGWSSDTRRAADRGSASIQ